MSRAELIRKITAMLERIVSVDHLNRIYRFVKYVYVHLEA